MGTIVARTEDDIRRAYETLAGAPCLGCDTETSGFTSSSARLYSIQFSDGDLNVLLPVSEGIPPGPLAQILSDPRSVKVFHNAKFDLEFLRDAGYQVNNIFDTMIAEKVLTRGAQQSASLAETLYRYFAVDLDKAPRSKFTRRWDGIWTDELVNYALADVVHLPKLMTEQLAWMDRIGLRQEFDVQMRSITNDEMQGALL